MIRTTQDLRDALADLTLPSGDWLERLDALAAAGIIAGIAAAGRPRWRELIKVLCTHLDLDGESDEAKSLRDAVVESARKEAESQVEPGTAVAEPNEDTIAQILVALGRQDDLFHDDAGGAFASVDHGEAGRETVPVGSERHEEILSMRLWEEHGLPPSSSSLHDAMRTLRAMAKADGPQRTVYLRHHFDGARLWYDLADERRRVVVITPSGWRIEDKPEVHFVRFKNTKAQVEPVHGGSIQLLRGLLNVEDDAHWALFVGWLVQAIMPGTSRMGLMLGGPQGSAKSTNAKLARALVDPACAPTTALPRNEDDFAVVASKNAILAADNVSGITREMSDMLCACITGDGYARRTKYRDTDETIWQFQRPVLLNGIGNVIHFPDLLDRVLLVRCPAIRPEDRRRERELWAQFRNDAPAILGALFDAAAGMLRELDRVEVPGDIRMSDAAQVMLAAARGLGLSEQVMLDALRANASEQVPRGPGGIRDRGTPGWLPQNEGGVRGDDARGRSLSNSNPMWARPSARIGPGRSNPGR